MEVTKAYTQNEWVQKGTKVTMVPDEDVTGKIGSRKGIYASVYAFKENEVEAAANARLISAAPETSEAALEAIVVLRDECLPRINDDDTYDYIEDVINKLNAALTKAGVLTDK